MADSRRKQKTPDALRALREHLREGVTGCLTLRDRHGADLRVYVMQGDILASHGPEDGRWVIRRLVNNGALTESQGEEYTRLLASGERLDELLFGHVPDELLLDLLAARFRQSLFDFLCVSGLPSFEPMDAVFVDNIQVGHDSLALLEDLEVRRERTRGLRIRAGTITIRPGRGRPKRLEEARLLDLCDGPVRLVDLLAVSPMEQGETLDLLYEMIGAGLVLADGFFPADDDEPTEVSGADGLAELLPDSALEPADVWPEDVAEPQAAPVATNEDWATPVVEDATATVEVESEDEPDDEVDDEPVDDAEDTSDDSRDGPDEATVQGRDPVLTEAQIGARAAEGVEEAARLAAEVALRAEMERELEDDYSEGADARRVVPPGFDFDVADEVDLGLFEDVDREIGRGRGEGTYTSGIKDVVELVPRQAAPPPSDDDGIIEALGMEVLSDSERAGVRALNFGAPPMEEDDVRGAFDIVNLAMREIARTVDEAKGPGAGRAFVQLLLEGTPGEFNALFRSVDARKDGALAVEGVLRNLRERPRTEHRQLVHRGVEDLMERALTLSCEELSDEVADDLTERVLGFQRQLNF